MSRTIYTDRSRIEAYQRCNRLRYLTYHQSGLGIVPAKESLPLAVGKAVHVGLETLLRHFLPLNVPVGYEGGVDWDMAHVEDAAIAAALADFSAYKSALALDTTETAAQAQPSNLTAQMAAMGMELGMSPDDPSLVALAQVQTAQRAGYEAWLYQEQAAVVEGLVRAYARRRLRPLLEGHEVLEVEREGQWMLAEWVEEADLNRDDDSRTSSGRVAASLVFMSRPDALLRSRADNSLYLLSFKTASAWDVRKARDAEHDMQGLSEGVEVERRLGEWWQATHETDWQRAGVLKDVPINMQQWLHDLAAPPRILGIRYEYLLKGTRWEDKDLSARFGVKVWAQRSHLVRAYQGDAGWCWSYDFLKDDGSASKLYYKTWRAHPVWESMPMRQWIDMLDTATETMSVDNPTVGLEPQALGWHSDAQAQGYTAEHPLDCLFPPPLTVYRSDDQLRDWIDQVEAQERRVAESVAAVDAAADEGERRHLLNVHFPMARRACEYPTTCAMSRVCWSGEDMQRDPVGSGLYKPRTPHHEPEAAAVLGE